MSGRLPSLYPALSWEQARDVAEDHAYWRGQAGAARAFLRRIDASLERYDKYCENASVHADQDGIDTVRDIRDLYARKTTRLDSLLARPVTSDDDRRGIESLTRTLHQLRVTAARSAAWVCEPYEQSRYARLFNAASFAADVKYDRYESGRVREIESSLRHVTALGAGSDLLATSSGMAAYHMADAYLRGHVLAPGDTVLVAHGLYSEVRESMLKGFTGRIVETDLYDAESILDAMDRSNARVVYLDPMKNRLEMRMCDVDAVIDGWQARHPDRPVSFVIDGTMTTGADKPFDARRSERAEILYYSSCCKYLQLGQDSVSAGFLAFPAAKKAVFEDIRRAAGAILYDSDAWAYPDVDKDAYDWRMRRLTRNALLVGAAINDDHGLANRVSAVYPGLPGHPDFDLGRETPYLGSVLTFRFDDAARAGRKHLDAFVHAFVDTARAENLDVVNGESFGFGAPRIYVGWTPTGAFPPFLRLSAGDRPLQNTAAVASLLKDALKDFTTPAKARPGPVPP